MARGGAPWRGALLALLLALACSRAGALARRGAGRSLAAARAVQPGMAQPDYSYYLKACVAHARARAARAARACVRVGKPPRAAGR
jgi:hypothetical protein